MSSDGLLKHLRSKIRKHKEFKKLSCAVLCTFLIILFVISGLSFYKYNNMIREIDEGYSLAQLKESISRNIAYIYAFLVWAVSSAYLFTYAMNDMYMRVNEDIYNAIIDVLETVKEIEKSRE